MENIEHNLGWYVKSWCEANPSAALLLQMAEIGIILSMSRDIPDKR